MYNGIGLPTPRGSGTNGYVQRNLSSVRHKKDRVDYKSEEELKKLESGLMKKPNQDILDHERKRKVELKCIELEDMMEEQGVSETHQLAEANEKKNERLRAAFGISDSYVDGSSFDPKRRAQEAVAKSEPQKQYGIVREPVRSRSPSPKRRKKKKARSRGRSASPSARSKEKKKKSSKKKSRSQSKSKSKKKHR
ncbi:hypothetical protein scyTo_0021304 [Scyliorhinus torazame]|uniref:CWF21 domain-containing protein n=1 Tax=Scyliorhinus torazame TaxID=75743 RepID=A0A401Q6I4_SCYTO|nr:hypothetical protein [Scyliorhinus torazame]